MRITPAVTGTGQVANKDEDRILHPMALVEEAARLALDRAGARPEDVDAIFTTPLSAIAASDPAQALGEALGAGPGPRVVSLYSGAAPQELLAAACQAVAQGHSRVALVAGGIADASVRRARSAGVQAPAPPTSVWSQGSAARHEMPQREWGPEYIPEAAAGAGFPSSYFALVQSVMDGMLPLDQRRAALAQLLAPFTGVAARRPDVAWFPTVRSPDQIGTPSATNRMVAEPFTKLMCSFPTVDLAGALVVTAAPTDSGEAVYPVAIASGAQAGPPSTWEKMDQPEALEAVVSRVFALSGSGPDEMGALDLYSCFPTAVLLAARAIGLAPNDHRGLTATGGLPYFGGPGASYSLHGLACLFESMRSQREPYGMAVGVGGMVTYFSAGIYSLEPRPFHSEELGVVQNLVVKSDPGATGTATVEAFTVLHDSGLGPVAAPVLARTPSGARVGARCLDTDMARSFSGRTLIGQEVDLYTVDGRTYYRPL